LTALRAHRETRRRFAGAAAAIRDVAACARERTATHDKQRDTHADVDHVIDADAD
jgi:hypothetical protein